MARHLTRLAAGCVAALAGLGSLAACSAHPSGRLSARVVSEPPAGFAPEPGLSGGWALERVVQTSPVAAATTRAQLHAAGASSAYGRVFTAGSAFAVVAVVQAASAAKATALARQQTTATAGLAGGIEWSPTVVPNAFGYLFNGQIKGATQFCQGAWFARGAYAAHVYSCAPQPGDVTVLESVMRAEYARLA